MCIRDRYNNYIIFKYSHFHQLDGKNLYVDHVKDHWDLYKYSPSFASFFGLFAWLPDWFGLSLWNLLNVLVFVAAIWYLPHLDIKSKILLLIFILVEAVTSLQNSQSNLLIAGLIIWGFGFFEKRRYLQGTLCIVLTFFIKIFGIFALILALFYPEKRKILLWTALCFIGVLLLPLPITGFHGLWNAYNQYLEMLLADQHVSYGISVMGIIRSWFTLDLSRTLVSLAGLAITCIPLLFRSQYNSPAFRIRFVAALLLWMVLFNHKAESPTYIIAVAGVMLWFFSQPISKINMVLSVSYTHLRRRRC